MVCGSRLIVPWFDSIIVKTRFLTKLFHLNEGLQSHLKVYLQSLVFPSRCLHLYGHPISMQTCNRPSLLDWSNCLQASWDSYRIISSQLMKENCGRIFLYIDDHLETWSTCIWQDVIYIAYAFSPIYFQFPSKCGLGFFFCLIFYFS